MKPDLLPGSVVSLQPCQKQLSFESAQLPVQCWLEHLACGRRLERFSGEHWEEILLIQGHLDCNQNVYGNIYFCLTPGQPAPPFCAGNAGAALLRMFFGSAPGNANGAATHSKRPVEVVDFAMLAWNEIPARRPNDPGALIAELSTNTPRTRIASLMGCRPGWRLDDHDHPSDVLTFCIRGGGILGIGDDTTTYEARHLVTIPAGMPHRFQTGNGGALLAVFVFEPFLHMNSV